MQVTQQQKKRVRERNKEIIEMGDKTGFLWCFFWTLFHTTTKMGIHAHAHMLCIEFKHNVRRIWFAFIVRNSLILCLKSIEFFCSRILMERHRINKFLTHVHRLMTHFLINLYEILIVADETQPRENKLFEEFFSVITKNIMISS